MPQPSITYTIVTTQGERTIKTPNYHSDYGSIEEWLKENFSSLVADLKAGNIKGIYVGNGKGGEKVM